MQFGLIKSTNLVSINLNRYFQIVGLGLILCQTHCAGLTPKPSVNNIPIIDVLLGEQKNVQLSFLGKFQIKFDYRSEFEFSRNKPINIQVANTETNGDAYFDGETFFVSSKIVFQAVNSNQYFKYSNNLYPGSIQLSISGNKISIINKVNLETYLKGVVLREMGSLGKLEFEALKAQAIAARTYGLAKINKAKENYNLYDVRADVMDQVYSGIVRNSNKWINLAVAETKGEVIVFDNELIDCYYHSTCGGRTESGENIFALQNTPYLKGVADNFGNGDFCSESPNYRWTESFSLSDIFASLKSVIQVENNPKFSDKLKTVEISNRFPSGRVKDLTVFFSGEGRSININSNLIRNVLRTNNNQILRSNLFKIKKAGNGESKNEINLIGAGNGHGVGMCQWGAIGMAKSGYVYGQILRHYYRGTKINKVY